MVEGILFFVFIYIMNSVFTGKDMIESQLESAKESSESVELDLNDEFDLQIFLESEID